MTEQLPLPFKLREDHQLEAFVRGNNDELCARLLALGTASGSDAVESGETLWIHAGTGSGKTHLLQGVVAALEAQGTRSAYLPARQLPPEHLAAMLEGSERFAVLVVDDVDAWLGNTEAETELVRLYQERRHLGLHLVLSASQPPVAYAMALADWRSRAQGAQVFRLEELSEDDKLQVLIARSARLGLSLSPSVASYLLRHGPRGLPDMLAVLDRVDQLALAERRRLTVPLLKKALLMPTDMPL